MGFITEDSHNIFFGSDPNDPVCPYNPIEEVLDHAFAVVFYDAKKFRGHEEVLE